MKFPASLKTCCKSRPRQKYRGHSGRNAARTSLAGRVSKAAEPFAGRINFTYFSDLSFKQMQERVSTLPPDSYIFFSCCCAMPEV